MNIAQMTQLPKVTPAFMPADESEWTGEHREFNARCLRITYRVMMLKRTGNPVYAAEIIALCESIDCPPPDVVKDYERRARETGQFYSANGDGKGSGGRSDLHMRHREQVECRQLGEAMIAYRNGARSQGQIAREIGMDAGAFSKLCDKYDHWDHPWRCGQTRSVCND